MGGNVVTAAKWFAASIVISSIILVIDFSLVMNKTSARIKAGLYNAGMNAGSHVSVLSNLNLNLRPSGSFNVNLGNRDSGAFDIL